MPAALCGGIFWSRSRPLCSLLVLYYSLIPEGTPPAQDDQTMLRIPISRYAAQCLSRGSRSTSSRNVPSFRVADLVAQASNNKCYRSIHTSPPLTMGVLDDARTFFSRLTLRAEASHILVKGTDAESEQKINDILEEISDCSNSDKGTPERCFADAAAKYSDCPSGEAQGGSLGEFGRYSMVPEFDNVVFNEEVGVVHKVKTGFGYHLILIHKRSDEY